MSDSPGSIEPMHQAAPWPTALEDIVAHATYKAGWTFSLRNTDRGQGSQGLTLCILIATPNSYRADEIRHVMHYMIVPAAAYDTRSWTRWLLEQILLVERHEACEFFQVGGQRPYAPHHQPGSDPYTVFELGTEIEQRTSYKGEVS
jgi:hypothetical protein